MISTILNTFTLIICTLSGAIYADSVITGKVKTDALCITQDDLLVMLSREKSGSLEYLYQLELPNGGSYEFVVKPGNYILETVSSSGCISTVRVDASKDGTTVSQNVKLERESQK